MAATSVASHNLFLHHRTPLLRYHRLPLRPAVPIHAFGRSDFDGFARRLTSGEALRNALRNANNALEILTFESLKTAERLDRQFSLSRRFDSARRAAASRAREIDQELGIGRRWRSFSVDFSRNWPRYRKEMREFMETPLGKSLGVIFLVWFVLSGWWFRVVVISLWVLPLASPLLIGLIRTVAKNFVIEGACPACKRRFMGYRNQVVRCTSCRNIVWQPREDFSRGNEGRSANSSEPNIIDIDI